MELKLMQLKIEFYPPLNMELISPTIHEGNVQKALCLLPNSQTQ